MLRLQQVGERFAALRLAREGSQRCWQDMGEGCRQALRQGSQSARALMFEIGPGPAQDAGARLRDRAATPRPAASLQRAAEIGTGQALTSSSTTARSAHKPGGRQIRLKNRKRKER